LTTIVYNWDGQMQLTCNPGPPADAKSLALQPVPYRVVKRFVQKHHYLHYAPPGARACLGVWHGDRLVGVLMFGRPVARIEDQRYTLELTRMVLLDECPRNSESCILALAARWVRRHVPDVCRLIAYADPGRGHKGTIYRAAGWRLVGMTRSSSWTRIGRPRRDAAPGPKFKFELLLQKGRHT